MTPPNLLSYGGSLVLSSANRSSLVPYVTAGVGALIMFDKADLAINETQTFLMGNVGGGVKWFRGRWGLRADYRFIRVESNDDVTVSRVRAPGFFGPETGATATAYSARCSSAPGAEGPACHLCHTRNTDCHHANHPIDELLLLPVSSR